MSTPDYVGTLCVVADTLDDLMHEVVERIIEDGDFISASKGSALDLHGVVLVLTNPRARVSRSQGRGKLISAIGELCWYLSGSDDLESVAYYVPKYRESAEEDGALRGAYGPRICGAGTFAQLDRVISQLRSNPHTRQAVVSILRADDLDNAQKDVPCTCTLQFFVRDHRLSMVVHMRSNDAHLGLPHDVFSFTMVQEIVARSLGLELGRYTHMVGSLHIYEDDIDTAKQYLAEGWHSTTIAMPEMPRGDPWNGVGALLAAEVAFREKQDANIPSDPYWGDLARMLSVLTPERRRSAEAVAAVKAELQCDFFDVFLDDRIDRIEGA